MCSLVCRMAIWSIAIHGLLEYKARHPGRSWVYLLPKCEASYHAWAIAASSSSTDLKFIHTPSVKSSCSPSETAWPLALGFSGNDNVIMEFSNGTSACVYRSWISIGDNKAMRSSRVIGSCSAWTVDYLKVRSAIIFDCCRIGVSRAEAISELLRERCQNWQPSLSCNL
jgi:hypothetical protein